MTESDRERLTLPIVIRLYNPTSSALRKDTIPEIEVCVGFSLAAERYFSCRLEACAPRGKFPAGGKGLLYTAVHEDSAESSCLGQAAEWLQDCLANHPLCAIKNRRKLQTPSRVIDVGPQNGSGNPSLRIADGSIRSWVALSYCWGGRSKFQLNEQTIQSWASGIPLSDFPATLRDAVIITRHLGLRYLWVDALCIKQDSMDDWRRECSRMRDVYKGATVTLIAATARSVHAGIFSRRTFQFNRSPLPWKHCGDGDQKSSDPREVVHMRPCSWNEETEPRPTQQRGWTLQEDLLSPRTLSYSNGRMIWQCSAEHIDEGGRSSSSRSTTAKDILQDMISHETRLPWWMSLKLESFLWTIHQRKSKLPWGPRDRPTHRNWDIVVFDYTSRKLSAESDMLPGIAGLASEFGRQTGDTYFAGLWRQDLLYQLMWSVHAKSASNSETTVAAPREYRSPSWSWASIKGQTIRLEPPLFKYARRNKAHERAKIVEVKMEPVVSSDPFGQVKAGHLILHGRFQCIGNFLEDGSKAATNPLAAVLRVLRASIPSLPGMKHEFWQQHEPFHRQHFALLQLVAWSHGNVGNGADYLVLESTTAAAEADPCLYRRVGFITLAENPDWREVSCHDYEHDPLIFGDSGYAELVKEAFREIVQEQEQHVRFVKKTVKIV